MHEVDRPRADDQRRGEDAEIEADPAHALLPLDPVEPDAGQREGAEQPEGVDLAEDTELRARHDDHQHRRQHRDHDRAVGRVEPLAPARKPVRQVTEADQRQEDVVAADERGVGGAEQQRRRGHDDRQLQRARAERRAQLEHEAIGVDLRRLQQRGLERGRQRRDEQDRRHHQYHRAQRRLLARGPEGGRDLADRFEPRVGEPRSRETDQQRPGRQGGGRLELRHHEAPLGGIQLHRTPCRRR